MSAETRIGTIGIIGAGHLGQAFARTAQRADRKVVIANSRGPQSLAPVVAALGTGVSASTIGEAAASAMVVIAVPWTSVPAAVAGLAWSGEIVIDATNTIPSPTCSPWRSNGRTSSEIVAELVAGARVVKAANTLSASCLAPIRMMRAAAACSSSPEMTCRQDRSRRLFEAAGFSRSISVTLRTGDACSRPRAARFRATTWCSCRESPVLIPAPMIGASTEQTGCP